VGVIGGEEAINCGFSGPNLRASGVPYDVRKDRPYYDYETYEFEVPIGEHGTATTGTWSGWKRCARACGSSTRRWTGSPRGP
jgi:NADH:ubiquinone oxidoreductase subunit D